MKYQWEAQAAEGIMPHIIDLDSKTIRKFEIIGVAVADTHTGEACFMPLLKPDGSVYTADCYQDVLGDIDRIYEEAVQAMGGGQE